ncbi:hypothetical protein DAEQUDRAFT_150426 [Daedalea quercina L-15889]|uniref:CHAT domain-containing protein n=1 Tax=Daedalea quercina L-15889 TaxID=1314783 RepID=A0A165KLY0_9APHY|nr:hypothetical protein DAEQUDRAFT_150426 [Daedalea quercina L-15889]
MLIICRAERDVNGDLVIMSRTMLEAEDTLIENTGDLDVEITHLRQMLAPSSTESEVNVSCMQALHTLSLRLQARFQRDAHIVDLEESIELGHQVESAAIYVDHPYLTWFHHCMVYSNPEHDKTFTGSGRVSNWTNTSATDRFASAVYCANSARTLGLYPLAIRAYKLALLLADRCTTIQFDVDLQRQFLARKDARRLASKAVACAIEAGDLEAAVEMAEQGRSRIWSVLRDNAYPLDHLIEVAPHLAQTFRETCVQLELLSAAPSDEDPFADVRPLQLRAALERWNANLVEIRRLDGFFDMLRPKCFETLRGAAQDGPIILLNIDDESRSDAIILRQFDEPVLVPLDTSALARILPRSAEAVASADTRVRLGSMVPVGSRGKSSLKAALQQLWSFVCKPVVERLIELGVPEQSRIWWYPPGMMASSPVHAAGPYVAGERNLLDIFMSSYTSSILALIKSRADMKNSYRGVKLLAFGQSDALPLVTSELHNLRGIFGDRATIYVNDDATRQQAIDQLSMSGEDGECTHFACHGSLSIHKPFESSFVMYDRNLTLQDIVRSTATLGVKHLAFLALCHSAASGDVSDAPDEFISLAAGVQASGFRSVIGTLWTMADADGPELAQNFYTHLMRRGAYEFDPKEAAVALHLTVKAMRDRKVPVERWSTFVHIGI